MDALVRSSALASEFLSAIQGHAVPSSRNAAIAFASYDAVREHHEATVVLVERTLIGSALALLRPSLESCIVGLWATYLADDNEIEAFENGRLSLEPTKFLRRLQNKDDGNYVQTLEEIHTCTKSALNSYVHGGREAVSGRLALSHVGPNYSDEKVDALLTFADGMLIIAAMEVATLTESVALREGVNSVIARHVARRV